MTTRKDDLMERIESKIDSLKDHLDTRLSSMDSKIERIDGRVDNIDVTSAKQQVVLEEHVRRTNLLEQKVEPIQDQYKQIKLLLKIGAGLFAASGAGFGAKELLAFFG